MQNTKPSASDSFYFNASTLPMTNVMIEKRKKFRIYFNVRFLVYLILKLLKISENWRSWVWFKIYANFQITAWKTDSHSKSSRHMWTLEKLYKQQLFVGQFLKWYAMLRIYHFIFKFNEILFPVAKRKITWILMFLSNFQFSGFSQVSRIASLTAILFGIDLIANNTVVTSRCLAGHSFGLKSRG